MRRKEREIIDHGAIKNFLEQQQILRIAFCDDDEIYIVPVNYGFIADDDSYVFYFHGAKAGRKYELSQSKPTVGFEIDGCYHFIANEKPCDCTASFQSVIGTGKIELIDDIENKIIGLNAIMNQTADQSEWDYDTKMLDAVAIYKLTVQKISYKANIV